MTQRAGNSPEHSADHVHRVLRPDHWHPYGTPQLLGPHRGPMAPDLTRSTTFALPDAATVRDIGSEAIPGEFYPRYGHPSARLFEARVAELEGGEGAVSFASGMAAFHAVFCGLLSAGDTLLCSRDVYGGITSLVEHDLPRFGITVRRFDPFDPGSLEAVWDDTVRLVHVETPTNPLARVVDLARIASFVRTGAAQRAGASIEPREGAAARDSMRAKNAAWDNAAMDAEPAENAAMDAESTRTAMMESQLASTRGMGSTMARTGATRSQLAGRAGSGVLFCVDGTFVPPPLQQPLRHGVDLVVHSATKFLGGHHDAIGGVVTSRHEILRTLERFRRRTGGILGPDTAWLLSRSLLTLELRARTQAATAEELAHRLESMRREGAPIERVHYPGLPDHPDHEIAKKQMQGYGAMLGFVVPGGVEAAVQVYDRFRLIARAVSLGGVDTLSSLPLHTSHAMTTAEQRTAAGIEDGLIRLSVGLETAENLAADVEQALAALKLPSSR